MSTVGLKSMLEFRGQRVLGRGKEPYCPIVDNENEKHNNKENKNNKNSKSNHKNQQYENSNVM